MAFKVVVILLEKIGCALGRGGKGGHLQLNEGISWEVGELRADASDYEEK